MKVFIAGGGNVGTYIARDLSSAGHNVTIIEQDAEIVARAAPLVPATWVCDDACEPNALHEAHVEKADVFVAATGDDEDNLVMSLLAKQEFAVPRVIARVNNPKNEWLFNSSWGVDIAVSTPHLLSALVEEAVSVGALVRLMKFEKGTARLVEVTLAEGSPAAGKSLVELNLPHDGSPVAVIRHDHVIVPDPSTILQVGDEVMILVTGEVEDQIRHILVG